METNIIDVIKDSLVKWNKLKTIKGNKMNIDLDYLANINIQHRYKAMTIEIEDSYGNLSRQVIQSIIDENGIDVLFEGVLDKEDLRKLYLYFKEDFEEIILEEDKWNQKH